MKQCINCLSENVSTIVEKNHIFYYCSNCKEKNESVINNDGINYSTKENGLVKHITVGAIVEDKGKLLLIKRQNFPFGFGLPSTHLHNDETVEEALKRIFREKIGLSLKTKKLIFHQTLIDPCRYGGEIHECYFYQCKPTNLNFVNVGWGLQFSKISELKDMDLVSNAKIILSRINLLDANSELISTPEINRTTNEGSVIDNLPMSIIIYNKRGKRTFTNNAAKKFLESSKNQSLENFDKIVSSIDGITKTAIKNELNSSDIIEIENRTYNLIATPLFNSGKISGATLVIKDITDEKHHEAYDSLTYFSSLALCSDSNRVDIAKTIIKQVFNVMDIVEANLMVAEGDTLHTTITYSANKGSKHAPFKLKLGQGVAGKAAENRSIIAVPNTSRESSFIPSARHKARSLLSVPIIFNGQIFGVLNLTKPKNSFFSENETKTASVVATKLAQTIQNEKIYKASINERQTFETVLKTTTDGLIMIDKGYNLIFANEAAQKMLPLSKIDLESKTIDNYLSNLSEENRKKIILIIKKTIKDKKPITAEFVSKKGQEKIIKTKFIPIIESNRTCKRIVIGFENQTRLVNKQQAVNRHVKQLTELFKISSLSINSSSDFFRKVLVKTATIMDSELADIYFFDKKDDHTGLTTNPKSEVPSLVSQIMERNMGDKEFICNNVKNHFLNINNISKIITIPVKLRGKTVGVLYAVNKKNNYFMRDAKWLSIIADRLASRIETEELFEKIKNDEQQLKNIIENSGDGIAVVDSNDKNIVWNKAMENMTGFNNFGELKILNPEISKLINESEAELENNAKETVYREIEIRNFDLEKQWLGVKYSSLTYGSGKKLMILSFRDISSEKAIENRNKEFIYTTTHELRTPITAIKGYLSMILSGDAGEVNPKQRLYFDRVYKSTDRLVTLVEDLLKTAKLEEDKVSFEISPFNPENLVKDVSFDFKQKIKDKNLDLKIAGAKKNLKILGDYDKTKQVLSNVIDNAIKYTVKGNVSILIEKEKDFGVIRIKDTGVGIPKKELEQVFTKFYRVPNSESVKAGGTGLGLFIVKNLIEKQGGMIEIESKLKEGTTISISLPLARNKRR